MKKITYKLIPFLLFSIITFVQGQTFNNTEHNVPESAIARLGNGIVIGNIVLSPDERKLIHRTEENNILIWDIHSKELINSFSGHDGQINDIALIPDGKTIASTGDENTILLWDISK